MSDNTKLVERLRELLAHVQQEMRPVIGAEATLEDAVLALTAQEQVAGVLSASRRLVNEQAEDEGLWFVAESVTEAYLQNALRKLHAAVESDATPSRDALSSSCSAGWVPVSERLPPYNKRVLLWWVPIDGNKYAECVVTGQRTIYDDKEQQDLDGVWYWANGRCYGGHHVTAWCEQPPPYTATKGDA